MKRKSITLIIIAVALPVIALAQGRQAETLASLLQRCWGAAEIKSSRNTDFDQDTGVFRGEIRRRWCRSSVQAWGPVERRDKLDYLTRIDSLTLRYSNDTLSAELNERAGQEPRLTVRGRAASADWWQAEFRERVLRLAQLPLPLL